MECPRCHARTIVWEKSRRVCKVPQCFYEDQHPISFDNDVRHYQGQKNGQNRFSTLYNAALDHGGVSVDKEANYDKQLKKGLKNIKDICLLLKLSQKIQNTAEARFITILKLQIKGKLQKQQRKQKQKKGEKQQGENQKQEKKKVYSLKQLACYSVYSACFENQNFFEDNNLARWLQITKKKWDILLSNLNNFLKNQIDFIPIQKTWHYVIRVCRKRKIQPPEQQAMIKMCNTISQMGIQNGCPRKTVAACVFWKICEHSIRYRDSIRLSDICKKHDELKDASSSELQKYFDTTPDTIKKFFSEKMEKDFYQVYLPQFEGRINIKSKQ